MRLEIGGGTKSRGGGWVNMDQVSTADIVHDLTVRPWPVADDSCDEVYSSHCIEHVPNVLAFLHEIVRVGRIGCQIEIRCPHPNADLAFVDTHVHVFSPIQAINMDVHFPREFWPHKKRLKFIGHHFGPSFLLEQAKRELPFLAGIDDQTIMRWIPRTAHETVFRYEVVVNEYV